jgi:putative tricarboxylic transport membrane protein
MGFILGEILEQRLRESLSLGEGSPTIFLTRPICTGIILLTALIIVVPLILDWRRKKQSGP